MIYIYMYVYDMYIYIYVCIYDIYIYREIAMVNRSQLSQCLEASCEAFLVADDGHCVY